MATFYLETSALLKRYRDERGSTLVDELFEGRGQADILTTSYFTILEIGSVATRLLRANNITRTSYQQLLANMTGDLVRHITLQSVSDRVLTEAFRATTDYALRAPDAIHLATATTLRLTLTKEPFVFVCSDIKLKSACEHSGLAVLDPESDSSIDRLNTWWQGERG